MGGAGERRVPGVPRGVLVEGRGAGVRDVPPRRGGEGLMPAVRRSRKEAGEGDGTEQVLRAAWTGISVDVTESIAMILLGS